MCRNINSIDHNRLELYSIDQSQSGIAIRLFRKLGIKRRRLVGQEASITGSRQNNFNHTLPLLKYCLETYVTGPEDLGFHTARQVTTDQHWKSNPLVVYGPSGSGKTHLLQGIIELRREIFPNDLILYMSAAEFTYQYMVACRDHTIEDFRERNFASQMVVVEDIDYFTGNVLAQDEFMSVVRECSRKRIPMVFSSNQAPATLPDIQDDLRSRLQGGLVCQMQKLAAVQRREAIEKMYTSDFLEKIDPVVLYLIVEGVDDMRKLKGTMNKLQMCLFLYGEHINQNLVRKYLGNDLQMGRMGVTIANIIDLVCNFYTLRKEDVRGSSRERRFVRPRQVIMYLSRLLTNRSLSEIGHQLGRRDHSTILHGVRKVAELMITDLSLQQEVIDLLRKLGKDPH